MPTRGQEQRALEIALATLDAIGNAAPGPTLQQYARQQKARAVAALYQDTHMTPEPKPDEPGDAPEPPDQDEQPEVPQQA